MEKPKLTEQDNNAIDEALDYLYDGINDNDEPEFEEMTDRLIALNEKVKELFKNQ